MIARLNLAHEPEHRLQTPRPRRQAGAARLAVVHAVPHEALMATLLAFDTSTERMAVALLCGERILVHEAAGGAQASAALIPAMRALLHAARVEAQALDAIAFGRGPGAFTGLRTACAVAQGYAFGLDKPVLALDTLMAVAEDARQRHAVDDVWVAMDARMDEVYAAHYRHAASGWQVRAAPALYAVEALNQRWHGAAPPAVAGSALAAFGPRLECGAAQRLPEALPRANALASLALAAWRDGAGVDAAEALPLYLRDKVAFTTAERDAIKARQAGEGPT
jgi:tRNA threonylcarbamoyladenosine biosynthesis protein TsaB